MILFIPLASGQTIQRIIYDGLAKQTVALSIVPCVTAGNVMGLKNLEGEIAGRNLIKKIILERGCSDRFCAMQDRDIFHNSDDNYERCLRFMDEHENIQAVTMPFIPTTKLEHVKMTAMVIRTSFLRTYEWHAGSNRHICEALKNDLGEAYCYYPSNERMVEELKCLS